MPGHVLANLVAGTIAGRGDRPNRPGFIVLAVRDPGIAVGALLDHDVAETLKEFGFAAGPHERGVRGAEGAEDPVEPRDGGLRALTIADVPGGTLDRDERTRRIEDRRAPLLEPHPVTIRVFHTHHDRVRHLWRALLRLEQAAVVGVDELRHQAGVRVERSRRVSEHGLDRRTHVLEGLGGEDPVARDDVLGVLGEQPVVAFPSLQLSAPGAFALAIGWPFKNAAKPSSYRTCSRSESQAPGSAIVKGRRT